MAARIYLDVCALCRPFDDQTQLRVRLETDAVQLILSHVRSGHLTLMVSSVHDVEIGAIDELPEREHLASLLQQVGQRATPELKRIRQRAEEFTQRGLGLADAAHLAFAEAEQADFVTCDDRLLRQCKRVKPAIWAGTPLSFCEKENLK
jgi:predicted nucleic acid-binding protein